MFRRVRRVEKRWGHELWLHNSPMYCGKVLVVMPGRRLSFHYHEDKHETFTVLEGRAMLYVGERHNNSYTGDWHLLEPGTVVDIQPYQVHSLESADQGPVHVLEVSTQHRDCDSYRFTEAINSETMKEPY